MTDCEPACTIARLLCVANARLLCSKRLAHLNPNRVGHGTKQMVYERYGRYVEGLDEDYAEIIKLYDDDFIDEACS